MGQDVVLISRRPRGCELLSYVLNFAITDQVEMLSVGSTFSRINVPVIRALRVPYDEPAPEERALRTVRTEFDQLLRLEGELKALRGQVHEYRDALIAEGVTGQLDVSNVKETGIEARLQAAAERKVAVP